MSCSTAARMPPGAMRVTSVLWARALWGLLRTRTAIADNTTADETTAVENGYFTVPPNRLQAKFDRPLLYIEPAECGVTASPPLLRPRATIRCRCTHSRHSGEISGCVLRCRLRRYRCCPCCPRSLGA